MFRTWWKPPARESRHRLSELRTPKKERGWFVEHVVPGLIDKGVLGVFLVAASAVFGAKLESIKTADAQLVELTKRRIDDTNRTYERITKSIADADDQYLKVFDALIECMNSANAEKFDTCRNQAFLGNFPDWRRALYYTTEPAADDMWIEAQLRGAFDEYRARADAYRAAAEDFIGCVTRESWEATRAYTFGMQGLASVCFGAVKDKRDAAMAYRKELRGAVDRYVERSTMRPGLIGVWFGGR